MKRLLHSKTPVKAGNKNRTQWQAHYQILHREHIVLRICQAMIVVVLLQSLKLLDSPSLNGLTPHYNFATLHVLNMCIHLLLFFVVLVLLKHKADKAAKLLLPASFCSYILLACYLWHYNVNLQYYFLLAMFISCYVFDTHERIALAIAIFIQLSLFLAMQTLPSISTIGPVLHIANGNVAYLQNIADINTWVFGFSCLICALFIRSILSKNWQQLKRFEATQTLLLHKLFPVELMPQLLSTINTSNLKGAPISPMPTSDFRQHTNTNMQHSLSMGVIFLDIVDFTEQINNDKNQVAKKPLDWQSTYGLFSKFDKAIEHIDAKRIKTNGDQYILVIGLKSQSNSNDTLAMHTIEACVKLHATSSLKIRVGAAFGLVTYGVFDPNNPNFDIWGETVIRAARLEKIASSGQTAVDEAIYHYTVHEHCFAPPVKHHLKGLGIQNVYLHGV